MLAAWLKKHYTPLWWGLFLLFALPAQGLLRDTLNHSLGLDPLKTLQHSTGRWALIFLLLTLFITPLRRALTRLSIYMHSGYGKRLSDWNWIIRLRRMIGLYSFFYAALHLWIFMHFDIGWDLSATLRESIEKPYILVGMTAFALLLPLALTSNDRSMRLLGKGWRRLHRAVYVVTVLALLHFWWQMKLGVYTPVPYTFVAIALLGYRLMVRFGWLTKRPIDDGMEMPERAANESDQGRRTRRFKLVP